MKIIYHGFAMKQLDPAFLPLAEVIQEPGDLAPATQASVPSQMPLMVLPTSAKTRVKVRGHASVPGSGPAGETCGSCASLRKRSGSRNYMKCSLTQGRWTGGPGTGGGGGPDGHVDENRRRPDDWGPVGPGAPGRGNSSG